MREQPAVGEQRVALNLPAILKSVTSQQSLATKPNIIALLQYRSNALDYLVRGVGECRLARIWYTLRWDYVTCGSKPTRRIYGY
jgi:hypothetical protein